MLEDLACLLYPELSTLLPYSLQHKNYTFQLKEDHMQPLIQNIQAEITKTARILDRMAEDETLLSVIITVADLCVTALREGGRILLAGNGGSAADAQHLAAELVGRLRFDRPALPAIALTADTAILTAISNDYGYERIFDRQVEAIGRVGDVLIGLSTSACSRNLVRALERARAKEIVTVGLLGSNPGPIESLCDYRLYVPDRETQKIQEGYIVIGHVLCTLIEQAMLTTPLVSQRC
ncbi:Phosphoheptose isomerase 1 [invertebrate metagenome]|uniref:D-sedoheptulose-7-phosphate isomerase n=1 Tax=invertebrate metagenome TaxID=1711999 RepID=A0A484H5I2_9ZZZZ